MLCLLFPGVVIATKAIKITITITHRNEIWESLPFAGKFYLRVVGVGLSVVVEAVTLFVDASLFVARVRTAVVGTDAYVNFFLSVDTGVGKRSTSSIFPSDARSGIDLNLSFYSSLSSLRDSVTPVRRREDTEGDGYARLKVQIDCPLGVLSRMPFELLETTRKVDKKRLDCGRKVFYWRGGDRFGMLGQQFKLI